MSGAMIMRFPGGLRKALTLSYDDGPRYDQRLVEIMVRYGIKGTFNLNSGLFGAVSTDWHLTPDEVGRLYVPNGMEIAVHARTHTALTGISEREIIDEVVSDRIALEKISGKICCGMAYPYGAYNDSVIETLKRCGILFSRTVESTGGFSLPDDWLRLPATCHHNDPRLFSLADEFISSVPDQPQLFYLWGHSYEFNDDGTWDLIEGFCAKTGGRDDIWYAANSEIFEYIAAFKQLKKSADEKIVFNPTALELFFEYEGNTISVLPGQTVRL